MADFEMTGWEHVGGTDQSICQPLQHSTQLHDHHYHLPEGLEKRAGIPQPWVASIHLAAYIEVPLCRAFDFNPKQPRRKLDKYTS